MHIDESIHALAASQHAALSISQAHDLGATRPMLRHRVRKGRLLQPTSYVLAIPGAPATHAHRLVVAALDAGPGAFVSHDAAAAMWRIAGFSHLRIRVVDVSRPRGGARRPSSLARIHHVRDLHPDHTTVLDGIPISTPTRVVFELAGSVHPKRAERALDSAWAQNLTSHARLAQMLDDWADRGRAGTVLMRELLDARPASYVPPASNLEARFNTLAERHGVGPFRRQVNLGGEAWIGRVDLLSERCPLVVEVLSEQFHAALCDQAADARRFAALEAAHFAVEPVWDHEIWGDATNAMERVRRAERRLMRARRAA
jgi:very-short-patch-repair endonuclease